MPILRLSRLVLRFGISIALLIAVLWATAALWIDGSESRVLAGALAGGALLAAALAAALVRPWWLTLVPGNDRDWQADVAKLPTATIEGSLLMLRVIRRLPPIAVTGRPNRKHLPPCRLLRPLSAAGI